MNPSLAAARNRLLAWAERRLPALTRLREPEALPLQLDRRRIYVLPTRFALGFALLLFVMLLGALNYGNNAALLMTCLLGASAGISLFIGFRAMSGLRLEQLRIGEVHAGDPTHIRLCFAPARRARASLRVRKGETDIAFALPADSAGWVDLPWTPARRGWNSCGRLRLWTEYPLGLFHIWSWAHPDVALLVFPALETDAPPLPDGSGEQGERNMSGEAEELAGLRDYRSNDARRLIAWKASLRHDRLLVRENEFRAGAALALDYAALTGLNHEARIRRLAAWVAAADGSHRPWSLRLPETSLGPGAGPEHRRTCMRALALLPHAERT
ncbi:DUF58 domain-containing protein [Dokdonella sp.]|uniref:DUF58 domain-containing protein n=1 Tax=Dokdonella sp. TaxID=2291710 RepID=UPI0025B9427E|nr:DUF58 domain-containing protein [Dokdonella sp.]MBX3688899.1 DUF58 domain-containing protein [Dokdonella sp.]